MRFVRPTNGLFSFCSKQQKSDPRTHTKYLEAKPVFGAVSYGLVDRIAAA